MNALRSWLSSRAGHATAVALSVGLVTFGAVLLASPLIEDVIGQWRQHSAAVDRDGSTPRYANAMGAAYEVIVDDFEASIVAFETGALPTTTDGLVIGLSGAQPALDRATARPDGRHIPSEPANLLPTSIRIPSIGLDQIVVEGVSRMDLQAGPGHYPGTALPGQPGNMVISGHRTTHTRPFYDLDILDPGADIYVDTEQGTFRYKVRTSYVVDPTDLTPLASTETATLTLTTCTPKGSAAQRLIVVADLDTSGRS